jgi:dienelactone hydrolase
MKYLFALVCVGCVASAGRDRPVPPTPDAVVPAVTPSPAPDAAASVPVPETADATAGSPDLATAAPVSDGAPAPALRQQFLDQLDRVMQRAPLAPQLMPASTGGGVVQQDLSIASTTSWRVAATVRKPATASGRLPVAIVLHETGADRNSGSVVAIASALVARGFLTVAPSGRYFGPGGGNDAYIKALKAANASPGHDFPFLYDTAYDVMRLVDYLITRDDVDPARIGLTGVSKGGMETVLVAAADPRIAAAAPIIGVQSFKWGLDNNAFQARAMSLDGAVPNPNDAASVRAFFANVAPGLVDTFDSPAMVPLVAPRPFLIIAGTKDPRNPMPGVQLVMKAGAAAYGEAADHLQLFTADVGHDGGYAPFHAAAVDWLARWLK